MESSTVSEQLVAELARFDIETCIIDHGAWQSVVFHPEEALWHCVGWLPGGPERIVLVQPQRIEDAASVLAGADIDRYVLTASLICALEVSDEALPAGWADAEALTAAIVPGGLDLCSQAAAHILARTHQPGASSTVSVGVELTWSGFSGVVVEVRSQSVLLQLLAGPALEVPAGEVVTIAGRQQRLIV